MTPTEAADKLRPSFHLHAMPPEDRHHVIFVEAVAEVLGVEPTAFNLHQVAGALDDANIHEDSNEYPVLMYSRVAHEELPTVYDPRHKYFHVEITSEDQAKTLSEDWVRDPAKLPALKTPSAVRIVEVDPKTDELVEVKPAEQQPAD